jgi:Na+/H+ antiporter NhaD/arsenite permease-like protein
MFLMPSSLLLDIRGRSLAIDGRLVAAGPQVTRKANQFNGLPIIEMAKLFAGIFITLIPAIAILRAGSAGVLAPVVDMVSEGGEQVNLMYFWATGILSRFLDNTPTYLVFFNTAAGDAELLTGLSRPPCSRFRPAPCSWGPTRKSETRPNFMVRAIAEERGVPMPSFLGYML